MGTDGRSREQAVDLGNRRSSWGMDGSLKEGTWVPASTRPAFGLAPGLGMTPASASANIRKLVDAGILIEATGRKRDQVFMAPEIVRFIGEAP
jgi:hypothetical protein